MSQYIQSVRGMNDILPGESELWELFEETVRSWLKSYGYKPIRLPIVEPTPLFKRAIGEVTDIVEKEMYSFTDSLNGELLTLRPEGTAGCVRALIQHKLAAQHPQRLYYMGQMFRHERPQKGRYRQFNQVGVEAFGFAGPDIDAELILMGARLWDDLGLEDVKLQLNSLGQLDERAKHRAELIAYFKKYSDLLDEDARRRLHSNPLRILDSKNPTMQEMIGGAPKLMDHLGAESMAHFEGVQQVLRDAGLPFEINPRLVRGLDYYTKTAFEIKYAPLGAQSAVAGGGRYDGLIEEIGGKPTPAVGFATGLERVLLALEKQGLIPEQPKKTDAFVVALGEAAKAPAFTLLTKLRRAGLKASMDYAGRSMKAQMKQANKAHARFALIIGEDEVKESCVMLKDMEKSEQQKVSFDAIIEKLCAEVKG